MERKKLVVIGGVAAGTKAASKAKRENPELDVLVITKDKDVSYAGCGLPYYLGGVIKERKELVVRAPEEFKATQDITVLTKCEVTALNPTQKTVAYTELKTKKKNTVSFDYLVFATGASPVLPKIEGIELENIYPLRSVQDAESIRACLDSDRVQDVVVIGAGFVGLEVAENLKLRGKNVTVVELIPFVLPGYDEEMSLLIQKYLVEQGVKVITGVNVSGFAGDADGNVKAVKTQAGTIEAQCVIWSAGVKPNVQLAREAGIKLGPTGTVAVNEYQETNIPGIYAVGDCAENINLLTKEPIWCPMGSTANKTGRIAGLNLTDKAAHESLPGVLNTSVIKLFGFNAARTGLTEKAAREKGYDIETVIVPANDKAHYYPGYRQIITKLIADRNNHRILGAQIIGQGVVDKPIDIIVTLISCQATLEQMASLDLAYAPPFSMAMSSTIVSAQIMLNKLNGRFKGINPREFIKIKENPEYLVVDVRVEPEYLVRSIPGSINIPFNQIAERAGEIPAGKKLIINCKIGKRAYLTSATFVKLGFDVTVLDGGIEAYPYAVN